MTPATHHAFRIVRMYAPHGDGRKYGVPTMRREGVSVALRLIQKFPAMARGSLGIQVAHALKQPVACGQQVAA